MLEQTNTKTSLQEDYKELLARMDVIKESTLHRLNHIDVEIANLNDEQAKLQDILKELARHPQTC